jgi:hypothetical protein
MFDLQESLIIQALTTNKTYVIYSMVARLWRALLLNMTHNQNEPQLRLVGAAKFSLPLANESLATPTGVRNDAE